MKDQKQGIINAIGKIATPNVAADITDHMIEVGLEKVSVDSLSELKGVSKTAAERVVGAIEVHNELEKTSRRRVSEPKPSLAEKYKADNSLEDRVEVGRKVAELRINATGSKPLAWRDIRQKLNLKNDEFHKVVRLEDHFKESVVQRIESFQGGWEYKGKLHVLLGFEPTGELLQRIEACKPVSAPKEEKPKSETKPKTTKKAKPTKKADKSTEKVKTETPKVEKNPEVVETTEVEEPTEEELEQIARLEVMDAAKKGKPVN